MKINGINGDLPVSEPRQDSKATLEPNTDFKGIFDHQLARINAPGEVPHTFVSDARITLVSQGDKLLSLLDDYAADLENPGKTLKQIAPLVNSIENEVSRIQETIADSSLADTDLLGLMDELTGTADVATYKFHRGDFL